MDRFVAMASLPEGLRFPPELDGRIRYDEARRVLGFRGFMCKAEFDRLSRLSDDWGYKRSLEELFRLCTLEPEIPPTNRLASIFARLIPRRDHTGV